MLGRLSKFFRYSKYDIEFREYYRFVYVLTHIQEYLQGFLILIRSYCECIISYIRSFKKYILRGEALWVGNEWLYLLYRYSS